MKKLDYQKLEQVKGGFSINGPFINALARGVEAILELGRSLGSAFRRAQEGKLCSY